MTLQPPPPSRHSPTDSQERNYQQIRVRQDTNENWLKNDPRPSSGEFCYSINGVSITRYVLSPPESATAPAPSEELLGTFIVDINYAIWRCDLNPEWSDDLPSGTPKYIWVETGETYTQPEVDPDTGTYYSNQCLKIGNNAGAPWSQLPWLGGRGQSGPQGNPGDGIRIVGVIGECGPPTAEQAPSPEIGDVWVVVCDDRSPTASACILSGCDGTAWVWSGTEWQFIGSLQGPAGNNVEYYYQEFAANAGDTKFQLNNTVQVQATFVTINGVILLPNDYTFTDNADGCELEFLNDIPLKDDDIIMVFSFKGAIDAAVRIIDNG